MFNIKKFFTSFKDYIVNNKREHIIILIFSPILLFLLSDLWTILRTGFRKEMILQFILTSLFIFAISTIYGYIRELTYLRKGKK